MVISLFGGVAEVWPLTSQTQSITQPTRKTTANLPNIVVMQVKPIDPAAPKPGFQLSDGSVDLMKGFSLASSEGIGHAWKLPHADETFDARYGQW